MYAVVDIETTGGYANANGITEIAIYVFDGKKVIDSFCSLIDPGRPIPDYIAGFTGITNAMVEKAPSFDNVAHKIYDLLEHNIFVAHNVNFDYSFVQNQLKESGYALNVKKLCTVRYSRKLFPGLKSYSLGNICAHFGIDIEGRHRAGGDAEATVKLLQKLFEADDGSVLNTFLKRGSKEYSLPPNLPREQFEKLPSTTGVYYFHDEQGKVVYVGKAVHIKKRITQHFTGNTSTKQKQDFLRTVHGITYTVCATELMALILESIEIRKHWPPFNRAQKHPEHPFGIYSYEDQHGYMRLCIDKARKNLKAAGTFRSMTEAMHQLQHIVNAYSLCPKLCGIDRSSALCDARFCNGACRQEESVDAYNNRASEALDELSGDSSYAIFDKGLNDGERSCVLIEKGRFYGMGYLPDHVAARNIESLKEFIQPMKTNFFIRELLDSETMAQWGKKVMLDIL